MTPLLVQYLFFYTKYSLINNIPFTGLHRKLAEETVFVQVSTDAAVSGAGL